MSTPTEPILFVVATMISANGETDAIFVEPEGSYGEGVVALTPPMSMDEAAHVCAEMLLERQTEYREAFNRARLWVA